MAEFSISIRIKLAKYIRLLTSDQEGEVIAAAEALKRTVKADGADIHTLADLVEQANGGKLNEAEMKKLFDAGYEAGHAEGVRAAEAKMPHTVRWTRRKEPTPKQARWLRDIYLQLGGRP